MENIFVEFLPPWIETGLQPAFYDKESGTVLQQTARMYARVNMLIRMFNKLSKNTKTTVEDYINQFNELHDYVHDYFDNLDVQEEINNKLDTMVEAGTLQEIVADYLNSKAVFGFDTVSDMQSATNLINGSYAKTLGYYAKNDNGGGLYRIEPMDNTITIDNGEYIAMVDTELVAHLVKEAEVNVRQFGAKGDDTTDDTTAINNAIVYCNTNKVTLYVPKGNYRVTDSLSKLMTGFKFRGHSRYDSCIRLDSIEGIRLITLEGQTGVEISDLRLSTNNYTQGEVYNNQSLQQIAIYTASSYYCSFNRLYICGFFEGLGTGYMSWGNTLRDCEIYYCTNGVLMSGGESNSYSIISTSIEYCNQGIRIASGFGNHLLSNTIQRCNFGISLVGTRGTTIDNNYFESNDCELRVQDGTFPTGTTIFTNNYVLVGNTTDRIRISTNSTNSICYIEKNTFRASNSLVSSTILGYADSTTKMFVAFNDNYVESPIVVGLAGNNNVKINDSKIGKNSITTWLSNAYTVTASSTVETLPLTSSNVNGSRFSITSNTIKSNRTGYVKISGKVDFGTVTAGNKIVRISINGTPVANSNTYLDNRGEITIQPFIYSVSNNDAISLEVYATASDTVIGNATTRISYLTVEEL